MELTSREYEIAELIALGYSEKEVASKLFVSDVTVHNHTYNIRKKNKLRSCVDIAREFILSLDNPKQYFASLALLVVQLFIVFDSITYEVKRAPKVVKTAKYSRVRTKNFA